MKILYFHQHFSTPKGATGIRSYEMARHLVSKGHAVTVVCGSYSGGQTGLSTAFFRGKRTGTVEGIKVIEFDMEYTNEHGFLRRAWTFLVFALRSILVLISEKYDIVFASTTPLTAGIPGLFARWVLRKPFVFEVRDLWPELPREMGVISNPVILFLMGVLEWMSYRSANRCIGLSPGIVKGIERCGVKQKKIALVPNGCDLRIFNQASEPWRPEGVEPSDLMAVFTGTHGIANGLDSALDAAAELLNRGNKDVKVVLVGQGKLKAGLQERTTLEKLTNVVFHEPVNKERLSGLMKSADIGLQLLSNVPAFYYGTSPNKFFDYISAGLPVLNNYPGWLAEMINDKDCGFVVPPDNPIAFADALESASKNRESLKTMGENALILAQTFDRGILADKWVDWVVEAKQ